MIPIVLAHGFLGIGDIQVGPARLSYFHRIDRAIASRGHPLIVTRVHPTGSITRRAGQLKQQILDRLETMNRLGERVVIFAHSMGGLDARYMIHNLGMAEHVRAVVTFATPHRGTTFADWCLLHLGQRMGALQIARQIGLDLGAATDLTVAAAGAFNAAVPDHPDVRYFSVSAARPWNRIPIFLLPAWRVIHHAEGDNDGLVSVRSAIWGEHLGTWPCDHLLMINKRLVPERNSPAGDITRRYLDVLDTLADHRLL